MNKFLTTLFVLAAACIGPAQAQAPAQQQGAPATAPAGGAAASLQAKTAMCIGCHGIRGYQASFPEVYKVPLISGQSAKYIVAALTAYKNGDRKHPTMRGIAEALSDQDMKDIAAYYESHGSENGKPLPEKAAKEPGPQVAALLQKAACSSCHGANFAKPIDPAYPKIAGQYADYMFVALKAYKMDNNPTVGRSNPIMGAIAKQFNNNELKALAGYVSSLQGDLSVKPESKFR